MVGDQEPPGRMEMEAAISTAFSPHSPINDAKLFAGRIDQVRDVLDTIRATGLHAVIYGERGVGKTPLASSMNSFFERVVAITKVNCSQGDNFSSVLRRSLRQVQLTLPTTRVGFAASPGAERITAHDFLPEDKEALPDEIAELMTQLPVQVVIIVDEFDRIDREATVPFADFLKALSDRGSDNTVILVGVGQSVEALIANHLSVERCLKQIRLPRMSERELTEIVDRGLEQASFSMASQTDKQLIVTISQGFPHYTHLICQNACRIALEDGLRKTISRDDVMGALVRAVESSDLSYREAYRKAVTGATADTLWEKVVLACARAQYDELGYFSSSSVVEEVSSLTGQQMLAQSISYHLGKLREIDRGPLLERTGSGRRFRFRFVNPMMRPFILMKALSDGLIELPA